MPGKSVTHPFDPACPYCKTQDQVEDKERLAEQNKRAQELRLNKKLPPPKRNYDRKKPDKPSWAVSDVRDPRCQKSKSTAAADG